LRPHGLTNRQWPLNPVVIVLCPGGLEHGGGIGRQMGYFLREQAARQTGMTYQVVDTRGRWFLGASPAHIGLSAGYLGVAALKLLLARFSLRRCVVHVNITGRGSTVRKAMLTAIVRALGLRYLLHVHDYSYGDEYHRRSPLTRAVIRRMFRSAACVLVLGEQERHAISQLLHLPAEQVLVLHNAVPDPGTKLAMPRADRPCELVFLGYLSSRKGVPDLLKALATPALASRHWHATLAGGGPVEEYRRLACALGVSARVAFPGWLDQAAASALCADADVLVLPSHAEGLAMSVLEGLAHGLAVIATPVGAHKEAIESEVSGLLVPPGDVGALGEALVRVIDDAALRVRLQAGARSGFLTKFNVRGYAERLGRLHSSLMSDRPSPRRH